MISALTGELRRVEEDRVHLQVGPILYELLIPASDGPELSDSVGKEMTFHTVLYLAGDPTRGNLEPTLIGFQRKQDRKFFNLFTTVRGIGPRTALKALTAPVGEIAQAIEEKNSRFLVELNGVGKRTAELIIAELSGKAKEFAYTSPDAATRGTASKGRSTAEQDAIAAIMALGESRRSDAELLLDRVKQAQPTLKTTDGLLREMLRLRSSRA